MEVPRLLEQIDERERGREKEAASELGKKARKRTLRFIIGPFLAPPPSPLPYFFILVFSWVIARHDRERERKERYKIKSVI